MSHVSGLGKQRFAALQCHLGALPFRDIAQEAIEQHTIGITGRRGMAFDPDLTLLGMIDAELLRQACMESTEASSEARTRPTSSGWMRLKMLEASFSRAFGSAPKIFRMAGLE